MIDDVPAIVPSAEARPSAEPPGETTLPAPTASQVHNADRVFSETATHHPFATLLGVAASVGLLRDIALDTFDTSGDKDEEEEEKPERTG
jgi:hypothetical protein